MTGIHQQAGLGREASARPAPRKGALIGVGALLVSADLSASLVPVPGTQLEVAAESLYGTGSWLSGVLALLVVVTVLISRARAGRRIRGGAV